MKLSRVSVFAGLALGALLGLVACTDVSQGSAPALAPLPQQKGKPMPIDPARTATLGGGCFWCLEAFYERIEGIEDVESGYSGGHVANPTYQQVSGEGTGHAEVVQLKFDPAKISYREILEIFFTMHDPTTLNRQGADEGTQYRSIILYHTPQQKADAEALIKELTDQQLFGGNKIVTQLVPFEAFYVAEISHQDYYERNPNAGYCRVVIDPKVKKLQQKFSHRLKAKYR